MSSINNNLHQKQIKNLLKQILKQRLDLNKAKCDLLNHAIFVDKIIGIILKIKKYYILIKIIINIFISKKSNILIKYINLFFNILNFLFKIKKIIY